MKKIFKSRIFAFVLGAIIFGSIGVVSAYTIFATDIGYTPKDTTWKKSNGEDITNVKDAIDDLYTKANNKTDVLWINSETSLNPTTLDVDLTSYSKILVVGIYSAAYPSVTGYKVINVGSEDDLLIYYNYSSTLTKRRIKIQSDKIIIENGNGTSAGIAVPMYIVGIK